MTNHQHDPLNEFMETCQQAQDTAWNIWEKVSNHLDTSPEAITWSDVGSAKAVEMMLQQVLNFIDNKE